MEIQFLVTGLGKQKILLRFPWLNKHNPDINWKTGEFAWQINRQPIKVKRYHDTIPPLVRERWLARQAIKQMIKPTIAEEPDREEKLNRTQNPSDDGILLAYIGDMENEEGREEEGEIWINAKTSNSIEFHLKHDEKKANIPLKERIPKEYHDYLDVFDEVKANRFPDSWPWDHKIELKEGFQPKLLKTYNLTPEEQKELDQWTKDNLDKGYI
jgi:hypothetical protein